MCRRRRFPPDMHADDEPGRPVATPIGRPDSHHLRARDRRELRASAERRASVLDPAVGSRHPAVRPREARAVALHEMITDEKRFVLRSGPTGHWSSGCHGSSICPIANELLTDE